MQQITVSLIFQDQRGEKMSAAFKLGKVDLAPLTRSSLVFQGGKQSHGSHAAGNDIGIRTMGCYRKPVRPAGQLSKTGESGKDLSQPGLSRMRAAATHHGS